MDTSTITATMSTRSGGPPRDRFWDVVITNPGGSSAVLVTGFTVTVAAGTLVARGLLWGLAIGILTFLIPRSCSGGMPWERGDLAHSTVMMVWNWPPLLSILNSQPCASVSSLIGMTTQIVLMRMRLQQLLPHLRGIQWRSFLWNSTSHWQSFAKPASGRMWIKRSTLWKRSRKTLP